MIRMRLALLMILGEKSRVKGKIAKNAGGTGVSGESCGFRLRRNPDLRLRSAARGCKMEAPDEAVAQREGRLLDKVERDLGNGEDRKPVEGKDGQ